jgi:hypothetical protein
MLIVIANTTGTRGDSVPWRVLEESLRLRLSTSAQATVS